MGAFPIMITVCIDKDYISAAKMVASENNVPIIESETVFEGIPADILQNRNSRRWWTMYLSGSAKIWCESNLSCCLQTTFFTKPGRSHDIGESGGKDYRGRIG